MRTKLKSKTDTGKFQESPLYFERNNIVTSHSINILRALKLYGSPIYTLSSCSHMPFNLCILIQSGESATSIQKQGRSYSRQIVYVFVLYQNIQGTPLHPISDYIETLEEGVLSCDRDGCVDVISTLYNRGWMAVSVACSYWYRRILLSSLE
jgi:hypothetical protein